MDRKLKVKNVIVIWSDGNWRSKSRPYWYHGKIYSMRGITETFQCMRFEVWINRRDRFAKKAVANNRKRLGYQDTHI